MMLKNTTISIVLTLVAASQAFAQNAPAKFVRFIPLGDDPPYREEIVNKVRVAQPPPRGSVPPSKVTLPAIMGEDKDFSLRLRNCLDYVKIDPEAEDYTMSAGGNPWLKLKKPRGRVSMAVLVRKGAGKKGSTWDKAGMMILPDDGRSFPHGKMRVVNTSAYKAAFKLGKNKAVIVKSGEVKMLEVTEGSHHLVVEIMGRNGKPERLHDGDFDVFPKKRINAFIYTCDGVNPRKSARMKVFDETYRAPR